MARDLWCALTVACLLLARSTTGGLAEPMVTIRESVVPSAFRDLAAGSAFEIRGTASGSDKVWVRVTRPDGADATASVAVAAKRFTCVYPADFGNVPAPVPGFYCLDVCSNDRFAPAGTGIDGQAEAAIIVFDSAAGALPDLPSAFMNDLYDEAGRTDRNCTEWPAMRRLVNRYMHSRGAALTGMYRPGFDLEKPEDLVFFKDSIALYDYDYRDRDWSVPLNGRPCRQFWQAVWDHWFNSSNNHPLDGNPGNASHDNYRPYTFTNDYADILLGYIAGRGAYRNVDDNAETICREGLRTLAAMQIRAGDACEPDEGPGTFRYGMFENGEPMVKGTGWFVNPGHHDYVAGGVFLGRAVWALGVGIGELPPGPETELATATVRDALRWAFGESRKHGYCRPAGTMLPETDSLFPETGADARVWRDPGEHGYLLMGMLAATRTKPDLTVFSAGEFGYDEGATLEDLCIRSLDALRRLVRKDRMWMNYSDKDATALAALAEGAVLFRDHPRSRLWREAAEAVGTAWLRARPAPDEYRAPVVHFGFRPGGDRMTYRWPPREDGQVRITFFKTGLWMLALAEMDRLTGEPAYRRRFEAMLSYLCGDNPFHARILSEIGGVCNWADDADGDTVEDRVPFSMYPESTGFIRYGIQRLVRHTAGQAPSPARE